jgi:C4-dicarboxylate-specific signal transduction histidine kinase
LVGVSQILFSVLFIHLSGGRIETHFHVFGSLAFLAFYRDWRPVFIGTVVTAIDHLVRGAFWPESVYGVLSATPWRALEHSAWVLFEDLILWASIQMALKEMRSVSESQAAIEMKSRQLAELNQTLEQKVEWRTKELKKSQEQVLNQQQSLIASSKMSALGEMAGGIAHEVNTPLAAIQMMAERAHERAESGDVSAQFVRENSERILKTTARITKIIHGLRTFCRDGSGDQFQTVSVKQLVEETIGLCMERFRRHDVQLNLEGLDEQLAFEGREIQISQVLLNLLNNAHDAVVDLSERWVTVSVLDRGSNVEIVVTDSGHGIPENVVQKIFQPFFTTKEIGKGTGLGLSIAFGIVSEHGGKLSVDASCPNTRFVIHLPKQRSQAAA